MADVYEKDLAQKSSLTTSDYIRVVGSDNVSYKQGMTSVKDTLGVTTLENRLKYGLLNSGTHDADNFEHLSSYMCHKSYVSNLPSDFNGNYVFVETYRSRLGWNVASSASNYSHQIATSYTDGVCYVRIRRDAGWSAWEQQPTRAEVDALKPYTVKHTNVEISSGYCQVSYPTGYNNTDVVIVQPEYDGSSIQGWTPVIQKASSALTIYVRQGTVTPANGSKVTFRLIFFKA